MGHPNAHMKRLLSAVLGLAMVLQVSTTAFAVGSEENVSQEPAVVLDQDGTQESSTVKSDSLTAENTISDKQGAGTGEPAANNALTDSPYLISDTEDLKQAIEAINGGGDSAAAYYQLNADIQLNEDSAIPSIVSFSGTLDGAGHSISGYTLDSNLDTDAFIRVNNGTIKNLAMTNVKVTGPNTAETSRRAGLCFRNYGTIEQCYVEGSVSGGHRAGGIVAENYNVIQNCYFLGNVTGRCETGGITAWNENDAKVVNCYVQGNMVTQTNNSGIIGGYGYTGTVYQGNVVMSGSTLTSANDRNHARICGRNNGDNTTFVDNLSCDDVTINGNTVADGAADNMQGLDKTAEALTQQSTYTAIGWNFDTIWEMSGELGRPVLKTCKELPAQPEEPEADQASYQVKSPDGKIDSRALRDSDGNLGYTVALNDNTVMNRASLGLTVDGVDMSTGVTLSQPTETTFDETYTTRGMHTQARNHYNQSAFPVTKGGTTMTLNFRVYDDGIAIQYDLPEGEHTITADSTRFAIPTDATAYYQDGGKGGYSDIKNMQCPTSTGPVSSLNSNMLLCALPTFELADGAGYINITEANIYDWSGMGLRPEGNGMLRAEYWDQNGKTFTTSEDSPWRVAIIADNLNDFANSDMVTNVSDPQDEELFSDDTSWIEPGRSVWVTLGGGDSSVACYKEYCDYASKLGIEFCLIETRPGSTLDEQFANIKEIADYAAGLENPVKIWVWEDSPTSNYPGGLYTEENARKFLQSCKEAGVAGVKIDHIHSETPDKVSFYKDFTKLAAEYQIMVSFHNPMKPTGLSRTYPNLMTWEAIKGMQSNCDANETAILPFTRLLGGDADYTPLSVSRRGNATVTHMLANTVVITSSYLQLSENPKDMVNAVYSDFIKELPTVWDETIVLDQSDIGSAAAFLRRSGEDWYLAVQIADKGAKEMTFDLDFLGEDSGEWYADIYYDNLSNDAQVKRMVKKVTSADQLEGQISSGGGYVVRLTQEEVVYDSDAGKTFEIDSAEDLDLIREHPDADFKLTADITLTGEFEPIPTLNGTLDGQGHTISGLTVTGMDAAAAFILQNNGTIKRLGLTNVYMEGPYTADNSWRAALCQRNYGIIEECYALGTVTGGHRNGGLVSENYNTIRNCYFMGTLESNFETGGITSWNHDGSATVENCYAGGSYTSYNNNMGFISGYAYNGTRMTGNVALSGSLTGNSNLARICGRNNGVTESTTYQNNLACADITINGSTVSGGAANNKNGQDKTADELKQQATYENIGWDFENIWAMQNGRPVLKNVPEVTVVDASATQIDSDTVWSYLDNGTDPASGLADRTDWADQDFDDSSWKTSLGSFGSKKGSTEGMDGGYAIHTLLDGCDGANDHQAYFFRTTVTVPNASAVQVIKGSLLYDDAAAVYLNGTKIAGFDDAEITANLQYGGSNASEPKTGNINLADEDILGLLKDGENTIAVELHQGRANSSDIYFDFTSLTFETEAPLFSGDMEWKYQDDNTDPAGNPEDAGYDRTSWTAADFDVSAWKTASGPFGSKRGGAELESGYTAKTVLAGCDGLNDTPAYFFRTTFNIPSLEGMTKLIGTLQHDDGAIVYINGQRVAAFDDVACDESGNSLGHGIDANLQYGGANASTPITSTFTLTDLSILHTGENTIAVELHNGRKTSSDIWFHFTDLTLSSEAINVEFSDLSLFVGADETERNLTWYVDGTDEAGQVLVAKQNELADGQMPENASSFNAVSSQSNDGGKYSNQATITGLEEGTTYAYQLVNSGVKSDIYTFTTGDNSDGSFSFAFAGDPQIGASGNAASDTEGWDKTLSIVTGNEAFTGIDFLLSAGDQVNTASDENQYNGYLDHEELTGLATATVVGNHDTSSNAYSQHFNEPNNSQYGATTASSDYYFVYDGVLFLVLNSNNMSDAEHKAFMQNAIEATKDQDIQWKVVTFHHSIYSVANHAVESDILQRRNALVPIFEELDIDVVLMGHDHVYVRSWMMDGLTPITESDKYTDTNNDGIPESVTDPDGILYVTANSASGSKFYEIQSTQFPYAAVKNQEHTPNISRVDVTEDSFTVTTYRTSDMSVVDTFTINRTPDEPALPEVTVSGEGGTATVAEDGTVTITPDEGYEIGTVTVNGKPVEVPADGKLTGLNGGDKVVVTFVQTEDPDTPSGGSSGSSSSNRPDVSTAGAGGKVTASSNGTVTITPDEGYEIAKIMVNGEEVAIPADGKLTGLDKNDKVIVTFAKITDEQPGDDKEPFADVADSAWYADAVQYVYEKGMMNGVSETSFAPNNTTTRAMIVTMLYRLEDEPDAAASAFTDVAAGSYYADAVAWAAANGIVDGISETTFAPDNAITREQMAAILYRYASFKGYDVSAGGMSLDEYADTSQISSYAVTAMQWANSEGLITGVTDTTLDPKGSATRAQVATILMRFCENITA